MGNINIRDIYQETGIINIADKLTVNSEQNVTTDALQKSHTESSQAECKKILVLAANPKNATRLRLDKEVREIRSELRPALLQKRFDLEQFWAVRPRDIQQAMLESKPQIVHFCGHGQGNEDEIEDNVRFSGKKEGDRVISSISEQEGLIFEGEDGNSKLIVGEALAELFKLCVSCVECVVLNGCYSAKQAKEIAQYIPYVVGMQKAIGDKVAIEFSVGFYRALGLSESYERAFELGCNAIDLTGMPGNHIPILYIKGNKRGKL